MYFLTMHELLSEYISVMHKYPHVPWTHSRAYSVDNMIGVPIKNFISIFE